MRGRDSNSSVFELRQHRLAGWKLSCISGLTQCTFVHTLLKVEVEWDPRKASANFAKHGIHFGDAVSALEDDGAVTILDPFEQEERWVTVGMDAYGRVIVVVYSWRGERLRLISARNATARERRQYEEKQR